MRGNIKRGQLLKTKTIDINNFTLTDSQDLSPKKKNFPELYSYLNICITLGTKRITTLFTYGIFT